MRALIGTFFKEQIKSIEENFFYNELLLFFIIKEPNSFKKKNYSLYLISINTQIDKSKIINILKSLMLFAFKLSMIHGILQFT